MRLHIIRLPERENVRLHICGWLRLALTLSMGGLATQGMYFFHRRSRFFEATTSQRAGCRNPREPPPSRRPCAAAAVAPPFSFLPVVPPESDPRYAEFFLEVFVKERLLGPAPCQRGDRAFFPVKLQPTRQHH